MIRLSSDAYHDATGVRHGQQTIERSVVTVGRDVLAMVDGGTAPKAVGLRDPEESIPVRYSISEGSADMAMALATVSSRLAAMPCRQIQPER